MPRRSAIWLGLVVLPIGFGGSVACAPESDSRIDRWRDEVADVDRQRPLDDQFATIAKSAVSLGVVEGLQYALVLDDATVTVDAFGVADRESGTPMTIETLINVASISKAVTAVAAMHLAEQGALDLDASISRLMTDEALHADLFGDAGVTGRMLLSHTSGLSGASVPVTSATQPLPSITDILRGDSTVPAPEMTYAAGSRFSYSGIGFLVLQDIIEAQTRRAFASVMAASVLEPARMRSSTYSLDDKARQRAAVYYRHDGRRREPYHLPGAAGGLYSTATDMAQFVALYTDARVERRRAIVSDDGFEELLTPAVALGGGSEPGGLSYALGHYVCDTPEGEPLVFHPGGNPGLRALFAALPARDTGIFIVTNNDHGSVVIEEMTRHWARHAGVTLCDMP